MMSNAPYLKSITQASLAIMVSSLGLVATANAAIWGRDINLNAVAANDATAVYLYDDTLKVTWLRDANAHGGGPMLWATANTWAQNLVTGSGATAISDWRLPSTDPSALTRIQSGGVMQTFNMPASSSEMASLFFDTLRNVSSMAPDGITALDANVYGLKNAGNFLNFKDDLYWSGTQYGPGADYTYSWFFQMKYGAQDLATVRQPTNFLAGPPKAYALAVRSGDVLAVPEPESYAMLMAGLGLLAFWVRRRQA
jgi:hypothetical protein